MRVLVLDVFVNILMVKVSFLIKFNISWGRRRGSLFYKERGKGENIC